MGVLILNMGHEPEKGRVRITVQFGDQPPRQYLAEFDGSREKVRALSCGPSCSPSM